MDVHPLRYTFISNLARAGVHPRNAQALARHSTIDLTMNVYTHVSKADLASDVENLPGLGDVPAEPDIAPVPEVSNERAGILRNWDTLPGHVLVAISTLAGA